MVSLPHDTSLLNISKHACENEVAALQHLFSYTHSFEKNHSAIRKRAEALITELRAKGSGSGVEAFLHSYDLETREGIAIMCLAEALLRIPDNQTADKLIEDTFSESQWNQYLGKSDSLFVNASTWGLLLTGKIINIDNAQEQNQASKVVRGLVKSMGEPVIREALKKAMHLMGDQFVLGETIQEAIRRAKPTEKRGYTTSYDILGEGARTEAQALQYFEAYKHAVEKVGTSSKHETYEARPSISVKLSALDPCYHMLHYDRVYQVLIPRLKALVRAAHKHNICISLDAEETSRLDVQLDIFQHMMHDAEFREYQGLSFVCQAYQKRAIHVIEWLAGLAKTTKKRIPVRLVKGAYWDNEIKWAQLLGLDDYPVFTRKEHTDVSYLACAQKLLDHPDAFYPQFATHNALTVASIIEISGDKTFEFQRLYGMGQMLYEQIVQEYPCRVYAPVGGHRDLLAYLIRRLLENGANTSFVNLLRDRDQSLDMLVHDPITQTKQREKDLVTGFPLPRDLYKPDRLNSRGIDLGHRLTIAHYGSLMCESIALKQPKDTSIETIDAIYKTAQKGYTAWKEYEVNDRATILEKAADLLEERSDQLVQLCTTEAKKTLADGIAEVREAVDFLRYYAARARELCTPKTLQGPTGESNILTLHPRGVFVCISPWNFPLAIFTGQIAAALVTGNSVLAKPAEQTPTIAAKIIELLQEAGIPKEALQLVCGQGETVGAAIVKHKDCAGVTFTGSNAAAKAINRSLAEKDGPIVPLIAETGGQNAMIVESSALLEHATDDIILSAFGSAGQRCSALRVLFVQDDIADNLIAMLKGAMDTLTIGPANNIATDIGPVIDPEAQQNLLYHVEHMKQHAAQWHAPAVDEAIIKSDSYVIPHLFEITHINELIEEHFGPILHIIRYDDTQLDQIISDINSTGYGLTFGLHSRIAQTRDDVLPHINAGNRYVNRNMTGATVGVQPFGGEGLSGTGPKAGGPHYLLRFMIERTTTINTTAIGGNLELLQKNLVNLDTKRMP